MTHTSTVYLVLTWLLAAFFLIGAVVNWIAPKPIREDYARWGYSAWFHYVTAILEALVAGMLLAPETRIIGAALGAVVMLAALATLVRGREWKHMIAPTVVLLVALIVGVNT